MLSKRWCVVLAVLGFMAFAVSAVSASGRGSTGAHIGGGVAAGCRPAVGSYRVNSERFSHGENGIFGTNWGCQNAYYGWGSAGYGWGYGYPGWAYELEGVPYFAQFPPVYYGYEDNMPVVKAPIRSAWAGSENPQPVMELPATAGQSRPPLRIINPYYVEGKAGKP